MPGSQDHPPPAPNQLFPSDPSSCRSASISVGGIYDAYLGSPSPRSQASFAQQQQQFPPNDSAMTTAYERPVSPVSLSASSAATDEQRSEGAGGLHRRSSSMVRKREEEGGPSGAGAGGADAPGQVVEARGAVPRLRTRSEQGWGEHITSVPASPDKAESAGVRRRASTVAMGDGSVVRRLPPTPGQATAEQAAGGLFAPFHYDDPFRASVSRNPFHAPAFDADYPLSGPSLSRVDSHPLSLAASTLAGASSDDEDSDAVSTPKWQPRVLTEEEEEEFEARSPLHPSSSTPPTRRRHAMPKPRLSSSFLPVLSPSPSTNRLSPNTSAASGSAGWRELSPSRASSSPSRGTGLVRRSTLSAAVGGLRHMSVRVVNVAGADSELLVEAETSDLSRSPSQRRLSRSTLATDGETSVGDEQAAIEEIVEEVKSEKAPVWEKEYQQYEKSYRQLRGKTLRIFGPDNRFRRACATVLTSRWTEPLILILILLSVVILTIQSAYNVYEHPRPLQGYFHTWEDYVLFGIFVCFTVEVLARIIVTGLVINPPRPPAPIEPSVKAYEASFKRSPSLASRVEAGLSPHPSLNRLSPMPSPTRSPGAYPPTTLLHSTDITSSLSSTTYDLKNASSVSLMRDNSHGTAYAPSLREPVGLGLGFSGPSASPNAPFSIKAALASSLPTASAAAAMSANATSSSTPYLLSIRRQRATYQQAFLRHSWNRIDFVAVVSFWISFGLSVSGKEYSANLWVFRALSVLRATRLLAVTAGTQTILQSLKKASPLLVNVGVFVAFAMVLFSIIGVQAFKGSYRRACQWVGKLACCRSLSAAADHLPPLADPEGILSNVTSEQFCGGYIDGLTGQHMSYLTADGLPGTEAPKGFLCGAPSVCIEGENSDNGAWSFDNVFAALMQVTIVASANTWTVIMFNMMDADFFVSCLFFIACLITLNFWLINMFVAVITNIFGDLRESTHKSAFAATACVFVSLTTRQDCLQRLSLNARCRAVPNTDNFDDDRKPHRGFTRSTSLVRAVYDKTYLVWVAAIVASVGIQGARGVDMSDAQLAVFDSVELYLTIAFDVEIALRVFASLPDWRSFFAGNANLTDTILAVVTTLIQIPVIHNSVAYKWLTCFQIARFYRVIIAIPRMRRLLNRVLGTFNGLINMILFLVLMTFIAALIAVQLFRGLPDPNNPITGPLNFYQIFNSFLAMYQAPLIRSWDDLTSALLILSSENWTDVINTVLSAEQGQVQIVIAAVFLCGWMFFSYCDRRPSSLPPSVELTVSLCLPVILMNMFIAVINENFAIAEEEKKARQLEAFINRTATPGQTVTSSWFRRLDPYIYSSARSKPTAEPSNVEEVPNRGITMSPEPMSPEPMQRDFSTDEKAEPSPTDSGFVARAAKKTLRFRSGLDSILYPDAGTSTSSDAPRYRNRDGRIRTREDTIQEHDRVQTVAQERRNQLADFITEHPSYDKTLFLFSQSSRIRQFCQRLGDPAYGNERIKGLPPSKWWKRAFNALVFAAIVGSVAIAAYATPLYRRDYLLKHGEIRFTWYNLVEVSLGFIFVLEFVVKIVADGFIFSPNAYLLSLWNEIDFIVLLTLLINIITALVGGSGSNRFTRALKAFRALRLINLWPTMRQTFYNVLIVGFGRILDASILALLYIVPFAVWGLQIFPGLLYSCNDSSVATKAECAGEYMVTTVDDWAYSAPRVWTNPYVWSFDSFRAALLILFEIISLEGWINVMESVMQIVGLDQQPQQNASQFNSLFFVLYNLIGAVFMYAAKIRLLMLASKSSSVIIDNFHRHSAVSLLTMEQRQWVDLRRLISRQPFRSWCFDRAVRKHGWWSRGLTGLYLLNIIVLMTQATTTAVADEARNYVFLGFTLLYLADIAVRITGLGWISFAQNGWNLYDVVVVGGTLATTIPILAGTSNQVAIQLQKLFLVSIVFKLVQRSDALTQLQKTAAASLPAILNIFSVWLVLFLVWAIFYIEIFGLTRWETLETHNANYYTFWDTMVMLTLQSTGEGWNQFMHDYTVEFPACTQSPNYLFSDCGSSGWAYALFITWNVLSMYLFTNLILGAVIENFSFVFQAYGKVTTISREEMRSFKKVWAEFDPERTGYLQRQDIVRFFGAPLLPARSSHSADGSTRLQRLSGIFEVKIYREDWSVPALQAVSRRDPTQHHQSPSFYHYLQDRDTLSLQKINLDRLRGAIEAIKPGEVERRKAVYNLLYHEAMFDAESSPKGISFNAMLTLLAHYCLIDDDNALQYACFLLLLLIDTLLTNPPPRRIDELIRRRGKLQHVMQRVRQDKLASFLAMIVLRRRYRMQRQAARRDEMGGVPEINVDAAEDSGSDRSERGTPRLGRYGRGRGRSPFSTPPQTPSPATRDDVGSGTRGRSASFAQDR
ncbi:SPOSA6832_04831 [Sporobolomyces salmonicolor]|uniref:Calcium-channel protein CCH1 n=1 Tax=Sporidiobolus salmonicolor TaxID=5005 RepID=A0A0D6ETN5_SPOSA|nr:SPOSA6832_04831 [Sporobolomyces salmonicolor]